MCFFLTQRLIIRFLIITKLLFLTYNKSLCSQSSCLVMVWKQDSSKRLQKAYHDRRVPSGADWRGGEWVQWRASIQILWAQIIRPITQTAADRAALIPPAKRQEKAKAKKKLIKNFQIVNVYDLVRNIICYIWYIDFKAKQRINVTL